LPSDEQFQRDRLYIMKNPGTATVYKLRVVEDVRDRVQIKADVVRASGRVVEWLLLHEMPPEHIMHTSSPVGIEAHKEIKAKLAAFFAACPFSRILLQTSFIDRVFWSVIYDRAT
jgi:hypothetical protein